MSNSENQTTKIEKVGIIISSIAAILTLIIGGVTIYLNTKIEDLRSDFEKKKLFSETLAGAIEHLSSINQNARRIAVVSLANSAETDEQMKEIVKVIILANNSENTVSENSYQLLIKLAGLNADKEKSLDKVLEDKEIKKMVQLFPPFPVTAQAAKTLPEQEDMKINLELKTQKLIQDQANNVKNLVDNMYSKEKKERQSAVSELSQQKYRSYDAIIVAEMLKYFDKNPENYFGIVNTLFILSKVENTFLKSNLPEINKLIISADKILNTQNKNQYLVPLKNRLNGL